MAKSVKERQHLKKEIDNREEKSIFRSCVC
jgi:hypothetical protein